jgi:peptidoglycan hydrolase-like protein with peptidoglycan-binding domain
MKHDREEYPLRSVMEIQQELIDRGHDIKVDGSFGPQTDLALTMELTK